MSAPRCLLLATFGNGQHGRLGHGTQASELFPRVVAALARQGAGGGADVVAVACGGAHTAAVTSDGALWTFGMNDRGQLGHSGDRGFVAEPTEVILPVRVAAVAAGESHTLALTTDGEVWAAGCNGGGQLGLGVRVSDALLSTTARGARGAARSADFRLVRALAGEEVDGGARGPRRRITGVAAGFSHSLAVDDRGAVWSWGLGGYGALGLGPQGARAAHPTPQLVAPFFGADDGGDGKAASAAAAAARGGTPKSRRQHQQHPFLRAAMVAAGGHHSGAVEAASSGGGGGGGGRVFAWGHGLWHQLGVGGGPPGSPLPPPENVCEPRPVESLWRAGRATAMAMGHAHTLAVVGGGGGGGKGGTLASWGSDDSGCLGQGMLWPRPYSPLPAPVHAAGSDDGRGGPAAGFWGRMAGKGNSEKPPPPPPLAGVVGCAAGWRHSAAVGAQGELWTWGWGGAPGAGGFVSGAGADLGGGQLGIGDPGEDRYAPTRVQRVVLGGGGGSGGAFLDLRGGGLGPAWRALQVSCGRNHTAAVVEVVGGRGLDDRDFG